MFYALYITILLSIFPNSPSSGPVSIMEGHKRLSLLYMDFCFRIFYMKKHLLRDVNKFQDAV